MIASPRASIRPTSACAICGVPVDAQFFDDSRIEAVPKPGRQIVLARFELHPEYCGVLECFSQYTDTFGANNALVQTPGLEWSILWNHRPLSPYLRFDRILNPWGYGSFRIAIRLPQRALVELVVKKVREPVDEEPVVGQVGGRILGRYWYDPQYGDVEPERC